MNEWKIGVVGAGHISGAHLEGWRRAPGCRVVGIFDRDRELAARRARSLAAAQAFSDLESLIAAADVVDICTPPASHAQIAAQAAAAGRHLLVEKPLVIEVEEWEQLSRRLSEAGVKLAVMHHLKFRRSVELARRWIGAGRIGELLRLRREFLTYPGADRMLSGRGHWSHGLPGGRWFETLPHALYLIHEFAGPLRVAHVSVLRETEPPSPVPAGEVSITLEGDRCLAAIEYSAHCRLNRRTLTFQGERGTIGVDLLSDSATLSAAPDSPRRRALGGLLGDAWPAAARWLVDRPAYAWSRLAGRAPHARLIAAFAAHLHDRAPSPTPLDEIDYVIRTCQEIGARIERRRERHASG